MTCLRCQAENPPGTRFCGQCATPLDSAAQPRFAAPESYTPKHLAERILNSKAALEGERKQITVPLADRHPEEARTPAVGRRAEDQARKEER